MQTAPPPAETPTPEAVDPSADWHALVSRGDALLARHQRDDALQAYLDAFDLVTDGRPVSPAEVEHLCKKLASYQLSFGSRAEARQTLELGRQTLKKMTAAKDPVERQKSIEQIENAMHALPRD
ncbi:hypothetical protein CfE428DRAFT_4711 [Chthoniobacter flavus Ellin428]|uniref:Tetratricopeptide repeat protein n=1 Tax=Chthoniobacter flavus Ellin428 TaxID=497964 RepID=B4D721_9BACT|nr:hypothetical protein [Chthoniobacter flavus]EDY17672.1 hypothetical protein CfE428DRAFT_4711 [Chthoniobacter flavus Ellin428]